MFAVIRTGGKQYKVAANDLVRVEKLSAQAGETITFDNVLMVGEGQDVTVGAPLVEGAAVSAEVVEQFRDKKVVVFKKKRRQKYRRTAGHRQELTLVRVNEILTGGAKPSGRKAASKPAKGTNQTGTNQTGTTQTSSNQSSANKAQDAAPKQDSKSSDASQAGSDAPAATMSMDIKQLSGVGPALEKKLADAGVTSLEQIANWTQADIEKVGDELNIKARIERDDWVGQAKKLLEGKV